MFTEKEKKSILNILVKAAMADKNVSDCEECTLDVVKNYFRVDHEEYVKIVTMNSLEALLVIRDMDKAKKDIFVSLLAAITKSDEIFSPQEYELVKMVNQICGLGLEKEILGYNKYLDM